VKLGWDELILPGWTKRKLQLIEQFIENPQLIRELGVAPPTGILLFGPPGTGKTTLARVLASETEASFFSVNAADIFSKWLGDSERRVKELFTNARARVPAIIFVDEIDACWNDAAKRCLEATTLATPWSTRSSRRWMASKCRRAFSSGGGD
jgi:transitional endoplasmic reticulum ATPase